MILLVIFFWLFVVTNAIYWTYVLIRCIVEYFKGESNSSEYPNPLNKYLRGF